VGCGCTSTCWSTTTSCARSTPSAQQLQRDGRRPAAGAADARVRALHRRPARRSRARLAADRHRPVRGRRVVNDGKLAVVLGIEVSRLFDCQIVRGSPRATRPTSTERLAEVHDLGVRQMEVVNKFDNAFSGVAGDAGETGVLVGGANFLETGSFWRMAPCEDVHDHDHEPTRRTARPAAQPRRRRRAARRARRPRRAGRAGHGRLRADRVAPMYPPGPHCNTMGLTDLGAYLLERMVERGMLFDPDHMSARARYEAMDLMEEWGYSGVVSSHSWADAGIYDRILDLGGVVTPMAGSSSGFVGKWRDTPALGRRPLLLRLRLRQRHQRLRDAGRPAGRRRRGPRHLPVRGLRGRHRRPAGQRRAGLRRQRRRGRPLRALPGLGRGPPPAGRRRDRRGPRARGRGVPADVGACARGPPRQLPRGRRAADRRRPRAAPRRDVARAGRDAARPAPPAPGRDVHLLRRRRAARPRVRRGRRAGRRGDRPVGRAAGDRPGPWAVGGRPGTPGGPPGPRSARPPVGCRRAGAPARPRRDPAPRSRAASTSTRGQRRATTTRTARRRDATDSPAASTTARPAPVTACCCCSASRGSPARAAGASRARVAAHHAPGAEGGLRAGVAERPAHRGQVAVGPVGRVATPSTKTATR
jgi:hypothetical protein